MGNDITTADYLSQLIADKATMVSNLQAKGVQVTGNETFTELVPAIAEIPSAKIGLVKFYDYNGTLFTEWTKAEALSATALPTGPVHSGLVFQEWNWTLSEIKDYINTYSAAWQIIVGPSYTTDNGATKMYVNITENTKNCAVELSSNKGTELTIDWGDGSERDSYTSVGSSVRFPHNYATTGDYIIQIFISNGWAYGASTGNNGSSLIFCAPTNIPGNTQAQINRHKYYFGRVRRLYFGNNMRWTSDAYLNSLSLEELTMPNTFVPYTNSRCNMFLTLPHKYLFLPRSIPRLGNVSTGLCLLSLPGNATEFYWNPSANNVYLEKFSFPDTITTIPTAWSGFTALKKLLIPRNVTTTTLSAMPKNLEELYIYANLDGKYTISSGSTSGSMLRVLMYYGGNPTTLTTLKGSFSGIDFTSLVTNIDISNFTTLESSTQYIFAGATKEVFDLSKVTEIKGSSLNYSFQSARCSKIIFSKNATIANPTYASYMVGSCYWLEDIVLPDTLAVANIGSQTALKYFKVPPAATGANCLLTTQQYLLEIVDYSGFNAVPVLSSNPGYAQTNYFPVLSEIVVPDALYEEWKAADYWNSVADKIVRYSDSSIAQER